MPILLLIILAGICTLRICISKWKEKGDKLSLFYIKQAKALMITLIVIAAVMVIVSIFLTEIGL